MQDQSMSFAIAMLIKECYSTVTHLVGSSLQISGLTHQQIMIMKLIAHNNEINISDLCKKMALTKGTVSGIVKRLENAGYVQKIKHQDDKRNTYVIFSAQGYQLANEFSDEINNGFQIAFEDFTEQEMMETKKELVKLRDKLKAIRHP